MVFRFLNIPVFIRPTYWLFLLFFCYDPERAFWKMAALGFVFFFSLLFHEYGHALAAQKFGRSPEITLEAFGGYASYDSRGLSESRHFIITLCGPLFTGLLIAISHYLFKSQIFESYGMNYVLYYTRELNIYWLIVNMAPLSPLDGGKISEYLLGKWFGAKGHRYSLLLGNLTAVAGALYFFVYGSHLFAFLFLFFGWQNFKIYKSGYVPEKPSAFNLYNHALSALENKNSEKARAIFEKLIKSEDEYIRILSLERLADLLNGEGKTKEAYKTLLKVEPEKLNAGKLLLCKLAYLNGNYALIEKFSRDIYISQPTFEIAMLNAKTFSQLKNSSYSVAWLKTAFQFDDYKNYSCEALLADPAFDSIRSEPQFQDLFTSHHSS
jgi:Zn-dependent protease